MHPGRTKVAQLRNGAASFQAGPFVPLRALFGTKRQTFKFDLPEQAWLDRRVPPACSDAQSRVT